MRASGPRRPTPELPSSPPAAAPVGTTETRTPAKTLPPTSIFNIEGALSDTETLGPSSPELPPLTAPPRSGLPPSTPQPALSSEGTFYTASWGSPYDIPPSSTGGPSSRHHRSSTASLDDIEEDSPNHQFGLSHLIPSRLTKNYDITPTRPSTPNQFSPEETPRSTKQLESEQHRGQSPSRKLVAAFAQYARAGASREGYRGNLENSNQSNRAADSDLPHPVGDTARAKRHRSRKSNLTLRQEDILPSLHITRHTLAMENSKYATPPKAKAEEQPPPSNGLNQFSLQPTSPSIADVATSPLADRRSSTLSLPGSKKRVQYKGKSCWISLPVDPPRGGEGQPPLPLSASELSERLAGFEKAGYDTRGFDHWRIGENNNLPDDHVQSVRVYPDPAEQWEEGRRRNYQVRFADKKTWDDYVKFLTEEKLRLLGVSLGGDEPEAPLSRQSSSQFGPHPFSPPPPTSSAGSQRPGQAGSGYPVGFVPGSSNHTSTRSIASPISSMGNPRTSLHMHRQSMFISPPNVPHQAVSPPGFTSWSPQPFGSHHMPPSNVSPAIQNGMPGHRSPVSPYNAAPDGSGPFPFAQRDELLAQMQRQQQQQLMQQQQQMLLARSAPALAEVPEAEVEEEKAQQAQTAAPEIVNPKPGHRHNISAKLEENVKHAGYRLDNYAQKQSEKPTESPQDPVKEVGQVISAEPSARPVPEWRKGAPIAAVEEDKALPDKIEQLNDKNLAGAKPQDVVKRNDELDHALSTVDTAADSDVDMDRDSKMASSTISNPWEHDSTFLPKEAATKPSSTKRHSSKFSFSKLNVEAKEFNPSANPSATFNPGIFSPSSFTFQPAKAKAFIPRSSGEFSPVSPPINTNFNVNAPAFSPSSFSGLSGSEFNFAAKGPAFKPTAPVFQPMSGSERSRVTSDSDSSTRIFNLTDIITPPKSSKALPIVKPTAQERRQANDLGEDENGRVTQENVKRARRFGDDGDDVPRFASPTPLPLEPVSHAKEDVDDADDLQTSGANEMSTTLVMEDIDVASEASATEEKLEERALTPATTEIADVSPIAEEQANLNDILVAQRAEGGRDSPDISPPEDEDEQDTSITQPDMTHTSRITSASSVLSALARPFAFQLPLVMESEQKPQPRSTPTKHHRSVPHVNEPLLSPPSSSTANRSDNENINLRSIKPSSRLPSSVRYYDDLEQPSFQEIDAVMQQFNEGGSDFGVERDDRSWPDSSVKDGSPRHLDNVPDFMPKLRSDAPSPSPRRALLRPVLPVEVDSASATQDPFSDGRAAVGSESPIRRLNEEGAVPVSDWDDFVSSADDERIRSQGKFFDHHVSELINGALHNRLDPVEKQLQTIQDSLLAISSDRRNGRVRSRATIDSDADDEDDDAETDLNSRGWSPKRDRRMERIKAAVQDALTAHHRNRSPLPGTIDLSGILEALADLKSSVSDSAAKSFQIDDVKSAVVAAIAQQTPTIAQTRSISGEVEESTQISEKYMEAVARAAEETEARKAVEKREAETRRLLKLAEEELALLRESSRDDSQRLHAQEEEIRSSRTRVATAEADRSDHQKDLASLSESNAALKATLEEYRISHDKWREDIDQVNREKEKLAGSFAALKIQTEEAVRIRETMRERLERLQSDAASATGKLMDERTKWQNRDAEHRARHEVLRTQVQAEARTRERLETEMQRLEVQEREAFKLRAILEHTQQEKMRLQADVEGLLLKEREASKASITLEHLQKENAKLEELVDSLRNECAEHEKAADKYAREYREAREAGRVEVQRTRMLLQADIETANGHVNIIRADMESELSRVRNDLESAKMDADRARAKQELILEQEADSKRDAIREVIEGKTAALYDQKLAFDERLEAITKQHRRDLDHIIENKNQSETFLREAHAQRIADLEKHHQRTVEQAIEDKDRTEAFFTDRASLDASKMEHLEDRIIHLEEKLEISKSAAQAAVQAAQSAKSLPVPSAAATTHAPERIGISARALRESIGVLQDQLQERERRIESLEQQASKIDPELPEKLKARDTEIGWLRELLGVRIDDLSEIVEILGQEDYSRDAVRNAAIRIRAGLQMEMHEKERQANGGSGPLSAVPANLASSLQNFASPRAAQLARAIGEWRNTPKGSSPSSSSILSGLATPPASNLRRTPPVPSATELRRTSAASSSSTAFGRPLTARQQEKSKASVLEPPRTPPLLRKASYDQDAESGRFSSSGFYDDEDSTVDGTPRAERQRSFGPLSPHSRRA